MSLDLRVCVFLCVCVSHCDHSCMALSAIYTQTQLCVNSTHYFNGAYEIWSSLLWGHTSWRPCMSWKCLLSILMEYTLFSVSVLRGSGQSHVLHFAVCFCWPVFVLKHHHHFISFQLELSNITLFLHGSLLQLDWTLLDWFKQSWSEN